ncbi:MAG: hypothetical protein KDB27_01735 [Planctomycetales bacterium]|nr:hypothetical protein [Planctomycetales bacterium]
MATDAQIAASESMGTALDQIAPPTNDVVQDFPAALDWRIVTCFVIVAAVLLYMS